MSAILHSKPWSIALSFALCAVAALALIFLRPAAASVDGRGLWDPADSDADGMSDEWEIHYFGAISARNGTEDDDLDDLTTVGEWIAGSNPFKLDPKAVAECGNLNISQPDGDYWHKVRLTAVYKDPVVIMGPAESGGWNSPLPVRVRNVTPTSFEFQFDRFEFDQGDWENANILVSWMVIEAGHHTLGGPDGLALEAGVQNVEAAGNIVTFSQPFATNPVILGQVASYEGAYSTTTRIHSVGNSSFKVVLQNQESSQPHTMTEKVSWVAIEPGYLQDEFGRRQVGFFYGVNSSWLEFAFPERIYKKPVFLANTQTLNGADTIVLRYKSLTDQKVSLRLYEDSSQDSETNHTGERVGWFAPKRPGMLHIEPTTGDQDADGMPDAWEAANGLAGGSGDIDGYYGDRDSDGLLNGEEYLYGTRADLADTDGDGISDFDEVNFYHSDALASDVAEFEPLFLIDGSNYSKNWGSWMRDETRAYQASARGWVEYKFDIAQPGVHAIELAVSPRYGGSASSRYELVFSVDGAFASREVVTMGVSGSAAPRILTPWLDNGTHSVRVLVDNSYLERRINVDSVTVLSAGGVDSNNNGLADWTEIRIQRQNGLEGSEGTSGALSPISSLTSPACIEGNARYPELTHATIREDLAATVELDRGPDDTWYANVPLASDAPTTIDFSFENSAVEQSQTIIWEATNLIQENSLRIRQGDSLLLAAWVGNKPNSSHRTDLTLFGESHLNVEANAPLEATFDVPGTHEIPWGYRRGNANGNMNFESTGVLTVEVVPLESPVSPICVVGFERPWEVGGLHPDALVRIDEDVAVYDGARLPAEDGFSYTIAMTSPESQWAVVRLGYHGPVLGNAEIRGIRINSGSQTGVTIARSYLDGSMLLEMKVLLSSVFDDLEIMSRIYRAGVTFPDGSTTATLTAGDFDEFGWATLQYLVPDEDSTNCHGFSLWQDGLKIAEYN